MRAETPEEPRPLRYGYTTGACATAVTLAAARLLLTGIATAVVEITLPRGRRVVFRLDSCRRQSQTAVAATRKDAGDDPDVTHDALVTAQVALETTPGIRFIAGEGVGKVTRPGLPIPPGEPAINPVPRRMITAHLQGLALERSYTGGFEVTIGVENGAELAKRTLNPRLGIVGGLSILGTTGIVRPFSCSAYIASIQQAIAVARANGLHHLAACTGAGSEQAMRRHYRLPEMALIEMGDFVGVVLKYLKKAPVEKLSLAGGFGKFSKLAAGHLDLHSHHSSIDLTWLAEQAVILGADARLQRAIRTANTSREALELAHQSGLPLGDWICHLARAQALAVVKGSVTIEVWALDRQGNPVGHAGFA
ncbi:MAG: cobalt-precorrin-5B (C(1))-methyltransferase [Candidatus Competibacteraceae bacterium]